MPCTYGTVITVLIIALHINSIKFAEPKESTVQESISLENEHREKVSNYLREQTTDSIKSNLTEAKSVFTQHNSHSSNADKITSKWENIKSLISQLKDRAEEIEDNLKKLKNNKASVKVEASHPLFDKRYKHHVKKWDQWSEWSPCSVNCGSGRQIRWRKCLNEQCSIAEAEMEEKICQLPECPRKFLGIF